VGISISKLSITTVVDNIEFFLYKFNDFTVLSIRDGWIIVVFNREGSVAISTSDFTYIISTKRSNILVNSSAIDAAPSIFSALYRITKPLASRIIIRDYRLLINRLRKLTNIKELE
jgi:hypothetical protein